MDNSTADDIQYNSEFIALRELSAVIGASPALVQGAGGNTSLKHNGIMWIKASGTWLRDAKTSDLFVPVAIESLLDAVDNGLHSAEKSVDFICQDITPSSGLRPSIETTVHALLPYDVVVHVHCVDTIAFAVQKDGEEQLAEKLRNFNWSWIPYIRPGLPLAKSIKAHRKPDSTVLVLGNHGLVVAADSVNGAAKLLHQVAEALKTTPRCSAEANLTQLSQLLSNSDYRLPEQARAHAVACDEFSTQLVDGGSLYPDHVIFLGEGSALAFPGESARQAVERLASQNIPAPVSLLFPGIGVAMHEDASPGQQALAQCLSDVSLRVPVEASIRYLSPEENHALLNWEAEHYRQELERKSR